VQLTALPKTSPPAEKSYELRAPSTFPDSGAAPDTVELTLSVEPWAHVFCNGVHLGTTPLPSPLRLPAGKRELQLRNPAFPPITVSVDLVNAVEHKSLRLADYAALMRVTVEPWGEIYVDGEHTGTAPLAQPLWVSPGRHALRFTHPQLPPLLQDITAAAGETLTIDINLKTAQAFVKRPAR
jgi:serine/threonine-protein kinase